MMAILRPDANDLPQWNLYDENCLVRHYSVELSHQSLLEAIWTDWGDDIAVSIAYGK